MKEFSDFIEDMKLIDFQLQDATYTWFKGEQHEVAPRIDRILNSEEQDANFNNLKHVPLQRLSSDHIPLALLGGSWGETRTISNLKTGGLKQKVSTC